MPNVNEIYQKRKEIKRLKEAQYSKKTASVDKDFKSQENCSAILFLKMLKGKTKQEWRIQ